MRLTNSPIRFTTDDAVATLWLDRDSLTPCYLRELAELAEAIARRSAVEVLVLRSAYSGGFPTFDRSLLGGLVHDGAAAEYARIGQLALRRLAEVPIPTLAFLEGPCRGPGLELALACDYRLAVATPDAELSLGPWPTVWGGLSRLVQRVGHRAARHFVSCYPRRAVELGLIDDAFCRRRGNIELRAFLDRLLFRPRKRLKATDLIAEAEQRLQFRATLRNGLLPIEDALAFDPTNPVPDRPRRVGVVGPDTRRWVAEFAIRGIPTVWQTRRPAKPFTHAIRSGRITPLEADQAGQFVCQVNNPDEALTADLVLLEDIVNLGDVWLERVMPARSILLVPADEFADVLPLCQRPSRVLGWRAGEVLVHAGTSGDAIAAASRWLSGIGESYRISLLPPVPLEPRPDRDAYDVRRFPIATRAEFGIV